MKTNRYAIIAVFTLIFLFTFLGCTRHYSTATPISETTDYPKAIERAKRDKRNFIMQSGINMYNINSVDLDPAKQHMTVTLAKADSLRLTDFKNPGLKQKPSKEVTPVKGEIYIYMKDSASYTLDEPHTIPFDKVARIELLH